MAREIGLDLVEISPNERPPVCKIMDYGKHKYLQSKKHKQKHHEQKMKEVRIRPKTDVHDRQIKLKHAREFLEKGDRVQFTMIFKGRERFHADIGEHSFDEIVHALEDIAKIERPPKMLGKRLTMILVPGKPVPTTKPKPKPPAGSSPSDKPGSGSSPKPAAASPVVSGGAATPGGSVASVPASAPHTLSATEAAAPPPAK